jgi:hypothetical protein
MINRILLSAGLASVLSMSAWAQPNAQFEVGVKGGVGAYGADNAPSPGFGQVGVEVCAYCGGRYALFGEYSHWLSPAAPKSGIIDSADLFGVGLRIQGRRRVRPFFDIGLAVGRDSFWCGCSGTPTTLDAHTTTGVVVGGGVMIPVGKHLYLRPQIRIRPMSAFHGAASAEVGFGWRF